MIVVYRLRIYSKLCISFSIIVKKNTGQAAMKRIFKIMLAIKDFMGKKKQSRPIILR